MILDDDERANLQELVTQLKAHGHGGSSASLSSAMNAFNVFTPHDLALKLARRLLEVDSASGGLITNIAVGGKGGAGFCNGDHRWTPMPGGEYCPGCGISRGKP